MKNELNKLIEDMKKISLIMSKKKKK